MQRLKLAGGALMLVVLAMGLTGQVFAQDSRGTISGTHQILIYGPGTALADVQRIIIEATPGPPPFPGFINDPNNRIYRGLDPRPLPQDRQESVTLADRGTYLVVCGLVPHFDEGMHGWIKVV